jgi:RNA-directed DNA polymerase
VGEIFDLITAEHYQLSAPEGWVFEGIKKIPKPFYKALSITCFIDMVPRRELSAAETRFPPPRKSSHFFGTINFGRVRGFFINDSMFSLEPNVATIIAQIACHDNSLPQGSPCSPVISNLIGNILDSRLLALARDARCTYTRYADDLTFSTNEKLFPTEIAVNLHGADWEVGNILKKTIEKTGFFINSDKTRMSLRQSRQTVTGLVVNSKANINQDYYRAARAMCNALFQNGYYFRPGDDPENVTDNLNPLEGVLSHIHFCKSAPRSPS